MSDNIIETFEVEIDVNVPGEDKPVKKKVNLAVVKPSVKDYQEAKKIQNITFSNCLNSNTIVRSKMDDVLRAQGLWNDEKAAELQGLQKQSLEKEKALAKGGIKLSAARAIALEIKRLRSEIFGMLSARTAMDVNSAEGQADAEQFNCLVSSCVVYNDSKKRYFASYEDYLNNNTNKVAIQGANILAQDLYGVDDNYEKGLVENRFLTKFGFMDDELRLVNEEGDFVDIDGNKVDEEGYLVNAQGKRVDKDGVLVDEDGDYLVEASPFLEDDGSEVADNDWGYGKDKTKSEEPKKKTKTKAKAKAKAKEEVVSETN